MPTLEQIQRKGHGFIAPTFTDTDYFAGVNSKLKGKELLPSGDWRSFLPIAEHQAPTYLGETNGCTYFATWNAIETNYKYLFGKELNMSDRMSIALALEMGIFDPSRGGTPKDAIDNIRKNYSVREDEWATVAAKDLNDFYSPPPQVLKELAKNRLKEIGHLIGYEYIPNPTIPKIKDALKQGPVCFSNALMPVGEHTDGGLYYRPEGWRDTHWAQATFVDGALYMRDQYAPFDKLVREDFIPEVAVRYEFNKELAFSLMRLIEELRRFLNL